MSEKPTCIYCESQQVTDFGVEIIDDESARHVYRCENCNGRWQLNGSFDIDWDSTPQITRQPEVKEWWK